MGLITYILQVMMGLITCILQIMIGIIACSWGSHNVMRLEDSHESTQANRMKPF